MELIDVHAHLTDDKFLNDVKNVVERAKENNVNTIICSASDFLSSKKCVLYAKDFERVFATVGVHPENIQDKKYLNQLASLAQEKKVVAIGEIGLDYHFTTQTKVIQKQIFAQQLSLANQLDLPVVVHSRDAMGDTIEILQQNPLKKESLMHCYSGSIESAKILMDLNFSFSFGGVSTFYNEKNVQEVIKFLPIDNILLETDSPYLAPVPFRGTINEPKNIIYIADNIARLKGLTLEELAIKTTANAKRIFNI